MKKNIFESQWVTIGNVIALASLIVGTRGIENEYRYVCYVVLMLSVPFYLWAVISVFRYNQIIANGQVMKATILPQSFRLKKSYRGTSQFEYSCKYNAQYYNGIVSVKDKDVEKMQNYVKTTPDINVVIDTTNNRSAILIRQYLDNVCYCLEGYFCDAKINYIMGGLVVLMAVLFVID